MKKPTFFISSTIYDFADLRSAIKYFLEQQGCVVLASEYNDFKKPLDVHSYQACLEAIHQADYFVLLVGARVGGMYDKDKRISITQSEYREAYKLHLEGKLKIINFIRSDIWTLRADRIELKKHLNTLDLESEVSDSIMGHSSKMASDPKFIIDFISEISRNEETVAALNGDRSFPSGNWLHVFSSFRDIVDVLQPEVFDGVSIDEAVIRRLLLSELREILRKSLVKFKEGAVYSPAISIMLFYKEHTLERKFTEHSYTSVVAERWDTLSTFAFGLLGLNLNPLILPQALSSSAFLRFNCENGAFEEEPVYLALHLLQQEIKLLNKGNTPETLTVIYEHSPKNRNSSDATVQINSVKLMMLLHLLQRWSNVITISKSIIRHLEGGKFVMPKIFDKSPIPNMNIELEKETVTQEELNSFIKE